MASVQKSAIVLAIASNVETPQQGSSFAQAKPLAAATPMRTPVKLPGPAATATASTWDSLYGLGSQTLDKAVTVKLTRTLAIIPITLVLAFIRTRKESGNGAEKVSLKHVFPFFILFFIGASVITTIATSLGVPASFFTPLKELSKFFIIMAMAAIGLNTDIVKLVKSGGKPITLGFTCWIAITVVSLLLQKFLGIW